MSELTTNAQEKCNNRELSVQEVWNGKDFAGGGCPK